MRHRTSRDPLATVYSVIVEGKIPSNQSFGGQWTKSEQMGVETWFHPDYEYEVVSFEGRAEIRDKDGNADYIGVSSVDDGIAEIEAGIDQGSNDLKHDTPSLSTMHWRVANQAEDDIINAIRDLYSAGLPEIAQKFDDLSQELESIIASSKPNK